MTEIRRSLVVPGGTDDLTGRLLLPAPARLEQAGGLGEVDVLPVSRDDRDDAAYRDWAGDRLAEHAGDLDTEVLDRLAGRLGYVRGNVTSASDLRRAADRVTGAPVFYLALPNVVFRPAVEALAELDLPAEARVVVEKPFGADLADARALNAALHRLLSTAPANPSSSSARCSPRSRRSRTCSPGGWCSGSPG